MTLNEYATACIDHFLEYRDKHGYNENEARDRASLDMSDPDIGIEILSTKELEKLKRQATSLPDSISEALNSGDGVYRP